ncbi:4-hydroxy-tetrahydrodipicolinate synthase [Bacillaceae bacterium S4-13-58]
MDFGNVLTAMVTPFDSNGEVDWKATRGLIHYLLSNGTDGLVIAGTTGESPTLSHDEKLQLFQFVVSEVNGRVPVIAGTGSNNTRESVILTKEAEQIGVDAVMLVTPYYNKPSQEGLYQHFRKIAESTSLPVMLYNIPGRSVVNMLPDTIIRLSEIKNIVSAKEASGELDNIAHIISNTPDQFSVYSGEDSQALPTLSIGGAGIISVSSHVIGPEMQEMIRLFKKGEVKKAAEYHRYLLPVMKAIFSAPSPTPVKEALNHIGIPVGSVRLPLVPLTETERSSLFRVVDQLKSQVQAG